MDPGEPLPFECLPGPGAAKGRNKRRSSILKQARPVLQVGGVLFGLEDLPEI